MKAQTGGKYDNQLLYIREVPRRVSSSCTMDSFSSRVGCYAAIAMVTLTIITFFLACIAIPPSGPYCPDGENCISYPYTKQIEKQFPRDYLWMFLAIPQTASYLVLVCLACAGAPESKRVFGTIAVAFATIGSSILIADYYVQLAVIMPSILNGEHGDGLSLLTMYNGRGVFIALEEAGYLCLGASLLALSPLFSGMLRLLLSGSFALDLVALLYINLRYGWDRSYRFEVAVISITWLAFIICGSMIAVVFLRDTTTDAMEKGHQERMDAKQKST